MGAYDREHSRHRDDRVDRVASILENIKTCLGREWMSGRDRSMVPQGWLPPGQLLGGQGLRSGRDDAERDHHHGGDEEGD